MSTRQGSASYTIVIGAVSAVIVGGIMLTFILYPMINSLVGAGFFSGFETASGARFGTLARSLLTFWGAIVMLAILTFIWIRTRQ